jgi:hypothetical protein
MRNDIFTPANDIHSSALLLLPLCVDVGGQRRRALWTAWDVDNAGRTGRWGALVAAGAKIRALAVNFVRDPRCWWSRKLMKGTP